MTATYSPIASRASLAALSILAAASSAFAADLQSWNVATGDFNTGSNWSPGFVGAWPADDTAEISNSGTATMSSGSATLVAINVGQNGVGTATGTMEQTGGSITLTNGLVVGRQGAAVGAYNMTGGTLSLVNFRLGGGAATSEGTMTVSGVGTAVTSSGTGHTSIGSPGTGTLTLQNSATWTHDGGNAFFVGSENNAPAVATGGTGTLNVLSGAELDLTGAANLTVGRSNGTGGVGTLNVNGGSISLNTGLLNLAASNAGAGQPGGTATLTLTSGSISAPMLNLLEGTSTVNFDGGAATFGVVSKTATLGSATIHFNGTRVVAAGDQVDFYRTNGAGTGTLTLDIAAGGQLFDTDGHVVGIAAGMSGVGTLTKLGAGTLTISGANTYAGGTIVAEGTLVVATGGLLGTGAIVVEDGGLLDFDYDFTLTTAGLVLETGSVMMLDQDLTFAGLTIEETSLPEGTYDYANLKSTYGDIFADGGTGQITVVPEPSTFALLVLGAAAGVVGAMRRRRIP